MERIKQKCARGQREALLSISERLHMLCLALDGASQELSKEAALLSNELDYQRLAKRYDRKSKILFNRAVIINRFTDNLLERKLHLIDMVLNYESKS